MPGGVNGMRRWVRIFVVTVLLVLPFIIVSVDYLEDIAEAYGEGVANVLFH